MLDQLAARGAAQAQRRAAARRQAIAASLSIPGVTAHVEGDAVVLQGRALARRFATNPALRWRLMEVRDGE